MVSSFQYGSKSASHNCFYRQIEMALENLVNELLLLSLLCTSYASYHVMKGTSSILLTSSNLPLQFIVLHLIKIWPLLFFIKLTKKDRAFTYLLKFV